MMNSAFLAKHDWRVLLAAAVFACLPTMGAFGGGSYAGLVLGLAAVLLLAELVARRLPEIDRSLAIVGGLFVILLWASAIWSITPDRTLGGAVQMTGLYVGCIVLLGLRRDLTGGAGTILRVALIAAAVGPVLVLLDIAAGHPILTLLLPPKPSDGYYYVKLNRGLGHLDVLIWPILAFAWVTGRRWWALFAAAALFALLALLSASNLALFIAFIVGLLVLGIAAIAPRVATYGLGVLVVLAAVVAPIVVRLVGVTLIPLAEQIKESARHRLEIWDYMTRRAFERPLTGWGWQSGDALPIRPEELARYEWVSKAGAPHSHDFWIQLWVETGVVGAILGLVFTLLILRRTWRQPSDVRPFALAAFATAFFLSLPSYNLGTDTWWCALAATGLLFAVLPHARRAV